MLTKKQPCYPSVPKKCDYSTSDRAIPDPGGSVSIPVGPQIIGGGGFLEIICGG